MNDTYNPQDRRPIASRELGWVKRFASFLATRGVSANAISVSSMFFAIAAGGALALTSAIAGYASLWYVCAALLILTRLLANMFDGMVAVQSRTASPLGELYNEVPDRVSDSVILIGAGYSATGTATAGLLAAFGALLTAYIRCVGKSAGAPHIFIGPMAKQQRMFLVITTSIILSVMPVDWQSSITIAPLGGLMSCVLLVIAVGTLITSWRRLTRVASHLKH